MVYVACGKQIQLFNSKIMYLYFQSKCDLHRRTVEIGTGEEAWIDKNEGGTRVLASQQNMTHVLLPNQTSQPKCGMHAHQSRRRHIKFCNLTKVELD